MIIDGALVCVWEEHVKRTALAALFLIRESGVRVIIREGASAHSWNLAGGGTEARRDIDGEWKENWTFALNSPRN